MKKFTVKHLLLLLISYPFPFSFSQGIFESTPILSNPQDEGKTNIELTGYARGLVYGGSEDFDFSNVFAEFAMKSRLSGHKTMLFADVRVREGLFFDQRELQIQLKEAFAGYRSDKLDVFLGNQIVAWGRTDGFNPTNNITPNDHFFLTGEPDDQKLSNFMLRTKVRLTSTSELDLIAIPFFKPSVYRFELFSLNQPVKYLELKHPPIKLENSTFAARLNFELPLLGFSLSYFNGYDPFHGFIIDSYSIAPIMVNYRPKVYHKQTIGADFALPFQLTMLRGEFALNLTEGYKTGMHIPNPDLSFVLGMEKRILETTAILQYIGKYTMDFTELQKPVLTGMTPEELQIFAGKMLFYESALYNRKIFNQHEQTNHAIMLSLSRSFLYEELQIEITGLHNITNEEWLANGNLRWSLTDSLSANLGGFFISGPNQSIYEMAGKVMNGVCLGLTVKF